MHKDRSLECLVLHYADLRISPEGLMSVSERLDEWRSRRFSVYSEKNPHVTWQQLAQYMIALEPTIKQNCTLDLDLISGSEVKKAADNLVEFDITL